MLTIKDVEVSKFKPTAKKAYKIQGMTVDMPTPVTNVLEGAKYMANPGKDVLLKGTVGELWVAPIAKVLKTYSKKDGSSLTEKDFKAGTYIELHTKKGVPCMAVKIPVKNQMKINTSWGDVLIANRPEVKHGTGDYVVCNAKDGKPDLSDVWVVNGLVFETTYKSI